MPVEFFKIEMTDIVGGNEVKSIYIDEFDPEEFKNRLFNDGLNPCEKRKIARRLLKVGCIGMEEIKKIFSDEDI